MGRIKGISPAVFLLAVILVLGGAPILKGALYLGKHEGDAMHLAELVLRMADGQWPHLDFMTPIGVLAVAPIAFFVKLGAGLGHAFFYAQILVALILFLPILRVVTSRMSGGWAYVYGGFVMALCLALVHGEAQHAPSVSMHYNRWAWAVSYLVIPLAVMAPLERARPWLDGVLIGLGMAALLLIKASYFVAFAPGILVALIARRQGRMILAALIAGLGVAALFTAVAGPYFWIAYLKDLLTVATGAVRQAPGVAYLDVISAPLYVGGSLALFAAVIFLRQAGRAVEGLALLLLMPGFFYVAYQNFGNDPQWLYLLAMLVFVLRPAPGTKNGLGLDLRAALTYTGVAALCFGFSSAANLVFSPLRHMSAKTDETVPLLPRLPVSDDVRAADVRQYTVDYKRPYDEPGEPFAAYRHFADRKDMPVLNGETLDDCVTEGGISAWFELVADDLTKAGFAGSAVVGTDLYSAYWMYGDFKQVKGAAPWYYGGLPGIENADYVAVPTCPMSSELRTAMLETLEEDGWTLREVHRSPLYILVKPVAP